ncbi:hypothetical protein SAMN05661091_5385 [Paenibacillus uliginis N3/975]|uniref:HTH cro/C1-type domain-containing protein n=1 Tax=Paenibacillus uliginis N3/975 TaxID=1313296 RepID=A0A1X7HR40_9BACL|nr:hypothetical protein [Paenibacillus uliginis]SMF91235.1 hypothetical protein SAMN05661091_5385 [Paenibacillus uliginis N3/975]
MKLTSEIIRICRTNLGMSQGKLAREAGISCPLLGAIERDERALLPHVESRIRKSIPLTDGEIADLVSVYHRVNGRSAVI